jgi:hypothetical protein
MASFAMTAAASVAVRVPHQGDEVGHHTDPKLEERAKAKIDACGIGKCETRHPRAGRCIALWSALERPVCFHGFSAIAALHSAASLDGVTTVFERDHA